MQSYGPNVESTRRQSRHRRRSVRRSLAVGVLGAAALVIAMALAVGDPRWWFAAALVGLLAGVVATRIVSNELAQARREAARDRADQAVAFQQLNASRVREHTAHSAAMSARLTDTEATVRRLRRALHDALRDGDESDRRARGERRRVTALVADVVELQARLAAASARHQEIAPVGDAAPAAVVDMRGWTRRNLETSDVDGSRRVDLDAGMVDAAVVGLDGPPQRLVQGRRGEDSAEA